MQNVTTHTTYSTFNPYLETTSNVSPKSQNSNHSNSLADILETCTVEEVLLSLYLQVAQQLQQNPHKKDMLEQQMEILDVACGMVEDLDDDDFYLIY